MPDPELPEWAAESGEELPTWAAEGEVLDDLPGTEAVPSGYRDTGDSRTVVQIGETAVEGDPTGRGRGSVSYDPTGERVVEQRLVAKDPNKPSVGQRVGWSPARIDPETSQQVGGDPRSALERLGAWATGEDPEALPFVQYAGLGGLGYVGTDEEDPAAVGGMELPSTHSAGRAIRAARRGWSDPGQPFTESIPDVISALLPTAAYEEGEDTTGSDLRGHAGVYNATDLATLGWADEVAGDAAVARRAREQAPGLALIGSIGGVAPYALIPGAAPTAAGRMALAGGTGLGLGTIRGAGESEASLADDPSQVARDAVREGTVEGLASAGTAGLAEAAIPALRRLGGWTRGLAATADDAAVQSRLEATGVWGGRAMRAADEMPGGQERLAGDLRRLDIGSGNVAQPGRGRLRRGWIPRPERTMDDVAEVLDAAGERMRGVVSRMDDAAATSGGPREGAEGWVNLSEVADELDRIAREYSELPVGGERVARALRQQIIEPLRQRGAVTFSQAHRQRQLLDEMIRSWRQDPQLSTAAGRLQTARRSVAQAMDRAAERLDPALRDTWRQANRDYSVGAFLRDYGRGAERLSVGGGIGGAVGTAIENAGGSVPVVGAMAQRELAQQTRMTWPGLRARGFEGLAGGLRAAGPGLEGFAGQLEAAARRGPAHLAAAHYALQRRNPAYRRAVEAMGEGDEEQATGLAGGEE